MQTTEPVTARSIQPTTSELIIRLADGEVRISWEKCSSRLASATDEQRRQAELSPGGYGIHWPLIDEDLSIGGLLRRADDTTGSQRAD
jgi:hypothetical protein